MIAVFTYVSVNKQKIIKQVTTELSKKIDGHVSIGNVELSFFRDFPKVSVLLHDVRITDTMFAQHNHPFLEAEEVFARLSIRKLWNKQSPLNGIKVNHGTLYIYKDTSGYSNDYLFKQKKTAASTTNKSNEKNELRSIELNDFRIVIDDRRKEKLHDLLVENMNVDLDDKDNHSFLFSVNAAISIHSMAFNLARGSFAKDKIFKGSFDMRYDKQLQQLQFDSINIRLGDHPINMSGRFDLSGPEPQFTFRFHAKDILYNDARSLLPEHISNSLSIVTVDNPLDAHGFITGLLKGGEPFVYINWASKEAHLTTPFLDFDEAAFTGYFTNEVVPGLPRKDPNSKIVINNLSALWHSLPVHSNNIEILDLSTPTLTCDLTSQFPMVTLNELIGAGSLQLTSGDAVVDMTYKGPIQRNDNTNSFINGSIVFKNGTVIYTPRDVEMKDVGATMIFKNSDVTIQNLQANVLNNKIVMQGEAKNLLSLMNTVPNNINIDWNIYSPFLNLNAFTYLLKSKKKTVAAKKNNKYSFSNAAAKIDQIIDLGRVHVQLKANKILYRKFEADNVSANILLLSDNYIINDVSMNHGGGRININGSLVPHQHNNITKLNMGINNVDVKKLFRSFENFGQDGITQENLEGSLTAKINASMVLNEAGNVDPASLTGIVDFSLRNGALNHYDPIKKIQRFIFKKRDFDSIHFAELKNRLEIKDREIKINRMEIQSSVLSMFVEGIYSQKGTTDISIQVPLNNLKKRDTTYIPENFGVDKKGGKSVFLRGRPGDDGSIKFKVDLLNKFNKEKKTR